MTPLRTGLISRPVTRRSVLRFGLAATSLLVAGSLAPAGGAGGPPARLTGQDAPLPIRMGMVILARRFADQDLLAQVITACHLTHNVPDIPPPRSSTEPDRRITWIRGLPYATTFADQNDTWLPDALRRVSFPVLCNHCDNPPCVRVCPTGATFRTPDGRVGQDPHRCIGCRYCMVACPFGARSFNFCDPRPYIPHPDPGTPLRMRGVVEKCTLCPDRLAAGLPPRCVAASDGAMVAGNLLDPDSPPRALLAAHAARQRLPSLGTGPAVWYVLERCTRTAP